mgnify:CR=1 FL=1
MKIREVLKNKSKLSLIIGLLITNNIQLSNHTYKLLLLLVHVKADDHLVLVVLAVLAVDSQAVHVLLVADGLVVHVTAEDLHLH